MEIREILNKIGLNEKEASVYVALLELGTGSVEGIAKKAETKRPTTYLILDSLAQKGLVSTVPRLKKALYTAESPEKILTDLSKKEELIKRFMPNLLALHNTKKEKPQILLFEGKAAVGEVYEKILSAKEVNFFATIRDHINIYPDFSKQLIEKTLEKKIKVREILTHNPEDIKYAKSVRASEYYEQRLAPKDHEFLTDNVLFDDHLVFFSYQPYIFAVLIQSKGIYRSLHTLFELAWKSAEPFDKKISA